MYGYYGLLAAMSFCLLSRGLSELDSAIFLWDVYGEVYGRFARVLEGLHYPRAIETLLLRSPTKHDQTPDAIRSPRRLSVLTPFVRPETIPHKSPH